MNDNGKPSSKVVSLNMHECKFLKLKHPQLTFCLALPLYSNQCGNEALHKSCQIATLTEAKIVQKHRQL